MRDKKPDLESRINRLERQNALLKNFMFFCFAIALIPYLVGISQTQLPTEAEMREYLKIPDVIKTKELQIIGKNNIPAMILKAEAQSPSVTMIGDKPFITLMDLNSKYICYIGHDDKTVSARVLDIEKNKAKIAFGVEKSTGSPSISLWDVKDSLKMIIGIIGEDPMIGMGGPEKSAKITTGIVDNVPFFGMYDKDDKWMWGKSK